MTLEPAVGEVAHMRKYFITTVSFVITISSLMALAWSAGAAYSPGPGF